MQQDLLQEIHIALWRSLAAFGERCSLRTWVYRVAHNVAATHVLRNRRRQAHRLTTLDEIDPAGVTPDVDAELDAGRALQKINALIQALKPLDRQVIILHLEGHCFRRSSSRLRSWWKSASRAVSRRKSTRSIRSDAASVSVFRKGAGPH
jgi:RNA polymerase sigma factor (sigma-70 family)